MKHLTRQSMPSNQATNSTYNNSLLQAASGPVTIRMTNDYLFRALLQTNNKVLRGLLCSLLQMKESDIESVEIKNPIILGETIDDKDFFLDIIVSLNNHTTINLEMQVINEHNWPERSLSYLCRSFDNLNKGMEYEEVKPAIQIGILDFTLFPEHPEFYATYQFLNVKNFTKYSDKLRLSVLDLTQIELATEEDIACRLDYWAALFKATTWEEIKMLAENNEYITEASKTIYQLTQEEHIRMVCEAREDYYRRQRSINKKLQKLQQYEEKIEEHKATIAEHAHTIDEQTNTIDEQTNTIDEQASTIENLNSELKFSKEENSALRARIAELEAHIKVQNNISTNE